MTPVCPHSLSFRPVILPDSVVLEFRVPLTARSTAWVCFDGKSRQELRRGDRVILRMSEFPMPTVSVTGGDGTLSSPSSPLSRPDLTCGPPLVCPTLLDRR